MTLELRSRTASIVLLVVLMLAHAFAAGATTEESVINGGEGEDRIEYNINPPAIGDPPDYWPIGIRFSFPALPGPGPFHVTYSDDISVVPPSAGSYVFGFVVTDATSRPVHQLGTPATFEFLYDALSVPSTSNACLGYFDEGTNEWECQDATLEQCDDGRLCGTTDHLSLFSIGPVPEPSTALLLGLGSALLGVLRRHRPD